LDFFPWKYRFQSFFVFAATIVASVSFSWLPRYFHWLTSPQHLTSLEKSDILLPRGQSSPATALQDNGRDPKLLKKALNPTQFGSWGYRKFWTN
jgi:hypothetical protein